MLNLFAALYQERTSNLIMGWSLLTMISKCALGYVLLVAVGTGLTGCDNKQEPIKATEASATQQGATARPPTDSAHKSENDLYIERLNKDVKVSNPDALLDEVNQQNSQ